MHVMGMTIGCFFCFPDIVISVGLGEISLVYLLKLNHIDFELRLQLILLIHLTLNLKIFNSLS